MGDTSQVFKAYDIRGLVGQELDAQMCHAIGMAFARHTKAERIVVARDMRESGIELSQAFALGARSQGCAVSDLGLASTDLLYFAAGHLDVPGAMFTASHNPAAYNGIKLCLSGARPVGQDSGLSEIRQITESILDEANSSGITFASGTTLDKQLASIDQVDLLGEWANHVRSFIDVGSLRPLKIVADTANGMGGFVVPEVFKGLAFEVEILFPELDGSFPNHPADPIQPENLVYLKEAVLASGADIGLAFDGDADRVFLIDEHAEAVSGSLTTALVAASMLDKHPGSTIIYNLICSHVVRDVIEEHGGIGVRTRVGHSFIKELMSETGAIFGGEHSGHYYFRDNYRADSGIITALVVLELMSLASVPLSELLLPYKRYSNSGEINTTVSNPKLIMEMIEERELKNGATIDHLDGLTVEYENWWYNLRSSNTEPLLRLNVEADSTESCQAHRDEVLGMVNEFGR